MREAQTFLCVFITWCCRNLRRREEHTPWIKGTWMIVEEVKKTQKLMIHQINAFLSLNIFQFATCFFFLLLFSDPRFHHLMKRLQYSPSKLKTFNGTEWNIKDSFSSSFWRGEWTFILRLWWGFIISLWSHGQT